MDNILNTKINSTLGEVTVRDLFKEALRVSLVEEPEKRLLGGSDWWGRMVTGLAEKGLVPGGVKPCCNKEEWLECSGDENEPCNYDYKCSSKEANEAILKLIDLI